MYSLDSTYSHEASGLEVIEITAPVEHAITLEEAKEFLGLPSASTTDDSLINALISGATMVIQNNLNRSIIEREIKAHWKNAFGLVELPFPNHGDIVSASRIINGETQEYSDYAVSGIHQKSVTIGRVYSSEGYGVQGLEVTYKSGWEDRSKVPDDFKHGFKLQVLGMYESRGIKESGFSPVYTEAMSFLYPYGVLI